tara:strand:+ start:523 stop:1224 length:702 start_codon:yes stop_codon:yes gene_type:complete
MLIKQLQEKQKKLNQKSDFYTAGGLHVYFKDPVLNDDIDVERVINKVEDTVPGHLLNEIEMIVIGQFEEFQERSINAFYDGAAIYISNMQDDESDLYDDIVHEISHSIEEPYGYEIYGDEKIKNEFLQKRKRMHDILWARGFKAPMSFFSDTEYNEEFDEFLHKKIGYDKLANLIRGLFISPYAATSLREYFATGFTDFYVFSDHGPLRIIVPELYKKISAIQNPEINDNINF